MENFFIYKFSRKSRFLLAVAFIASNFVQIFLGVTMSVWSLYVCLSVAKHLYSEKAEITFVFSIICIYGAHVITQSLVGIKICEKCFLRAHKRSTKKNLYCWLGTSFNIVINILIISMLTIRISKHIVISIRHSMEKGMRNYLKDPVWKHTIDRWQFNLQCCGVNDYKDWYELSWLDKYHIDSSNSLAQSFVLSKDHLHFPVVPWSCCNYNFPMQCFHDPLQQVEFAHMWKEQADFVDGTIYNKGCLEILKKPIETSSIALIVGTILLFISQIVIIVTSRLLYTSCRNAVVLRDQNGESPGWLFGRDCLSPRKGRTVSEVMLDLAKHEEPIDGKATVDGEAENPPSDKEEDVQVLVTPRGSEHDPISSGEEDALML